MGTSFETTFVIGEQVKVRNYNDRPDYWMPKMEKYMNQIVTIKDIVFRMKRSDSGKKVKIAVIKIKEDQTEVPNGWDWSPFNFENI